MFSYVPATPDSVVAFAEEWDGLVRDVIVQIELQMSRNTDAVRQLQTLHATMLSVRTASTRGVFETDYQDGIAGLSSFFDVTSDLDVIRSRLTALQAMFQNASRLDPRSATTPLIAIGLQFLTDWYPCLYRIHHLRRLDCACILYQCPLNTKRSDLWCVITRRYASLVDKHLHHLCDDPSTITHEDLVLLGLYALTYTVFHQTTVLVYLGETSQIRTTRIERALKALLLCTIEGS